MPEENDPLNLIPIYEKLFVGIYLALVGGFLDAYTYLIRGGVFANAQTGNMVLLGMSVSQGNLGRATHYLIPIIAFYVGVLISEFIKKNSTVQKLFEWQIVVVIVELILLFIVGFISKETNNTIVNATISLICAMQVHSFRKLKGMPYATTMCTGNLRTAAEHFYKFLSLNDQSAGIICGRYLLIILMFCTGAALGGILTKLWGVRAVWSCCILLLVVLGNIILEKTKL